MLQLLVLISSLLPQTATATTYSSPSHNGYAFLAQTAFEASQSDPGNPSKIAERALGVCIFLGHRFATFSEVNNAELRNGSVDLIAVTPQGFGTTGTFTSFSYENNPIYLPKMFSFIDCRD